MDLTPSPEPTSEFVTEAMIVEADDTGEQTASALILGLVPASCEAAGVAAAYAMSSIAFADMLLEKAHVVIAPGRGYGEFGEGFFRISLTVPDARLEEALERMRVALES